MLAEGGGFCDAVLARPSAPGYLAGRWWGQLVSDTAPSPLFYALGSLTSCNQVTANLVANDLRIHLGRWTFDIQGDLDTAVLVGGAEGNANFDKVEVRATVETDATSEQFDTLISETERRCPVTQLFQRSGLEFVNNWTRAELPARV